MTMMHTESYFAFGKYNGDDSYAQPANDARQAYVLNLTRADYEVKVSANTSADTSGGFVVRSNPTDPDQNALVHSCGVTTPSTNLGVTAAFRKTLAIHDKQIIIGFNLYIPADFTPNGSSSTVPCFRMAATTKADTNWSVIAITPVTAAKELFRVCNDLSLRWGTDSTQSSKKLRAGQMNYLEVRISPTEVSAWIDDTFVMQKQVSVVPETVAWIFECNANSGGTNMAGLPGRWAVSDLYVLANDGAGNTVRLGPTTRIKGARPTADVDVHFYRPTGPASNAAVAAQDLTDAPPYQLSSVNIGDYDLYSTTGAESVRQVAMIHGVAVKTLAANLEPDPHTVRSIATAGGNATQGAGQKGKELVLLSPIPSGRAIRAFARRPTDGTIWAVGDASSIWKSGANGDYTTWSKIADNADSNTFVGIAFRSDGYGVAALNRGASNGGFMYYIPAAQQTVTVPGVANTDYRSLSSVDRPSGLTMSYDGATWIAPGTYSSGATSSVVYSTNPATGWTAVSTNNGSVGGSGNGLAKSASRVIFTQASAPSVAMKTDNNGVTYQALDYGDATGSFQAITYDGTAFLIAYSSNDATLGAGPRIRRSSDNGSTWSAATPVGSSVAGASQVLRAGASNTAIGESVFCGDAGAIVASTNGIDWRQLPRLTTSNLYAAIALPNGDILMGGASGALVVYRNQSADKTLAPLSGYQSVFNCITVNPQTGLPWTPNQAADANFGMKLTS